MWFFKVKVHVEQRLHNDFSFPSAVWLILWYFKTYLLLNDFEQISQTNFSDDFLSLVWPSMWVFKMYLVAKDFEQTLQSARSPDFFSPLSSTVWICEWDFNPCSLLNFFLQVPHGYDASWSDLFGAYVGSCLSSSPLSFWLPIIKLPKFIATEHFFSTIFSVFWKWPICSTLTSGGSSTKASSGSPWKPRSAANSDSFRFKPFPLRREANRSLRIKVSLRYEI